MRLPAVACVVLVATPVFAQDSAGTFADAKDGAKLHVASGFVCPAMIGRFERDAAGSTDVEIGASACAYSALNGVYGTITLTPLAGPYDAKTALAREFVQQEATGGKRIAETVVNLGSKDEPLAVFTRTYETARAESLSYRTLFAGTAVGNWGVAVTVEYADPRDVKDEKDFLTTIYTAAPREIAH